MQKLDDAAERVRIARGRLEDLLSGQRISPYSLPSDAYDKHFTPPDEEQRVREAIARYLAASDNHIWDSLESYMRAGYYHQADRILAIKRLAILAEDQECMNIPDPDPHGYEGESEAISATKRSAYEAGWRKCVPKEEKG